MKNLNTFVSVFIILLLIVVIGYLIFKPTEPVKPIVITHTEYKDSPKIDSLKNINDSLKKQLVNKKVIYYPKYIKLYKDTFRNIHDTIAEVLVLGNDIIKLQDSIIANKDSIITDITNTLEITHDSMCYFQDLYIVEKGKVKKWKRISIASLLLNGLLLLK